MSVIQTIIGHPSVKES